jgi:hypothetical protein
MKKGIHRLRAANNSNYRGKSAAFLQNKENAILRHEAERPEVRDIAWFRGTQSAFGISH